MSVVCMTMIKISGLTKNYNKVPVVKNLNLDIKNGEIVGFAGLNGAGKSTTIRIASGIIFPSSGTVTVDEKDIVSEKVDASKYIGWVPELPNFEPRGKSVSLLKYYAGFFGIGAKEAEQKAEKLLKQFDIWNARKKHLQDYSQGMKKRFSIAAAMIGNPNNYLFDETLNGLDPGGVKEMRDLMLSMKKDGKAVFLSSHILSELQNVADRIAIIKNGELIKILKHSDLDNLGETRIIVDVKNPDDKIFNILNKFGNAHESNGDILIEKITLPVDDIYKINEELVKAGYKVGNVSAEGENLEEYFLKLVGGSI